MEQPDSKSNHKGRGGKRCRRIPQFDPIRQTLRGIAETWRRSDMTRGKKIDETARIVAESGNSYCVGRHVWYVVKSKMAMALASKPYDVMNCLEINSRAIAFEGRTRRAFAREIRARAVSVPRTYGFAYHAESNRTYFGFENELSGRLLEASEDGVAEVANGVNTAGVFLLPGIHLLSPNYDECGDLTESTRWIWNDVLGPMPFSEVDRATVLLWLATGFLKQAAPCWPMLHMHMPEHSDRVDPLERLSYPLLGRFAVMADGVEESELHEHVGLPILPILAYEDEIGCAAEPETLAALSDRKPPTLGRGKGRLPIQCLVTTADYGPIKNRKLARRTFTVLGTSSQVIDRSLWDDNDGRKHVHDRFVSAFVRTIPAVLRAKRSNFDQLVREYRHHGKLSRFAEYLALMHLWARALFDKTLDCHDRDGRRMDPDRLMAEIIQNLEGRMRGS